MPAPKKRDSSKVKFDQSISRQESDWREPFPQFRYYSKFRFDKQQTEHSRQIRHLRLRLISRKPQSLPWSLKWSQGWRTKGTWYFCFSTVSTEEDSWQALIAYRTFEATFEALSFVHWTISEKNFSPEDSCFNLWALWEGDQATWDLSETEGSSF